MSVNSLNFAWPVTTIGLYDYDSLMECLEENKELFEGKTVAIFGSGIRGTLFSILLEKKGYSDLIFVDNNPQKVGNHINKYEIYSLDIVLANKEKYIIIISVEDGLSIVDQLKGLGFIENKEFFFVDNHLYRDYVQEFSDKTPTDTLVFGDCGFTDISIMDSDLDNLGDMIKKQLGDNKCRVLAIHGMGMRAFYTIAKTFINYIHKPKNILLMTNLETFTGKQHLLPRSQHARLIRMLSQVVGESYEELSEYADLTQCRFDQFANDYFSSSQDTISNMTADKNDKIVMKLNYLYKMDMNSECVVYLQKFIDMCKSNNIKLLLYIPPANYQYGEELWGDRFTKSYDENVDHIKAIAENNDVPVLDVSYLLTKDKFADVCTIDETLNQEGRKVVAPVICDRLSKL